MVKRRKPRANPPAQPAPAVHDDYDEFSRWVALALRHAGLTASDQGVRDPLQQWQQLTPQNQASLAQALRDFWPAERRFTSASTRLDALVTALCRMSRRKTERQGDLDEFLQALSTEATTVQPIL